MLPLKNKQFLKLSGYSLNCWIVEFRSAVPYKVNCQKFQQFNSLGAVENFVELLKTTVVAVLDLKSVKEGNFGHL